MKTTLNSALFVLTTSLLVSPASGLSAEAESVVGTVARAGGKVTFAVTTNVPGISVHGRSNALEAAIETRESAMGAIHLHKVDAVVRVKTLATGMSVRDNHMRTLVFTTPTGDTPDLWFTAEGSTCVLSGPGLPAARCDLSGSLSIRGTARPFSIALEVSQNGGRLSAAGDGIVKLSAYGIEHPSQFGVTTADEVTLHLELTAAIPVVPMAASAGGQ